MASSLDRAVWLSMQRADLWERLGHEAHALLTGQPGPHGAFFAWLDRLVHDQGPLAPSALAAELSGPNTADELRHLHARVSGFHEVPAGEAVRDELEVIVDRLRLQAAEAELEVLAGTGALSDAARTRLGELRERQRRLKERLARPVASNELSTSASGLSPSTLGTA